MHKTWKLNINLWGYLDSHEGNINLWGCFDRHEDDIYLSVALITHAARGRWHTRPIQNNALFRCHATLEEAGSCENMQKKCVFLFLLLILVLDDCSLHSTVTIACYRCWCTNWIQHNQWRWSRRHLGRGRSAQAPNSFSVTSTVTSQCITRKKKKNILCASLKKVTLKVQLKFGGNRLQACRWTHSDWQQPQPKEQESKSLFVCMSLLTSLCKNKKRKKRHIVKCRSSWMLDRRYPGV